ncbi:hypothetical protein ACFQ7M_06815 [Streptomyces massasporeus]
MPRRDDRRTGGRGEDFGGVRIRMGERLDNPPRIVPLAAAVAAEHVERGVLFEQPPAAGQHADAAVVGEDPGRPPGRLFVPLHGDEPLRDAALVEPRLGGETFGGHDPRRNSVLTHDRPPS